MATNVNSSIQKYNKVVTISKAMRTYLKGYAMAIAATRQYAPESPALAIENEPIPAPPDSLCVRDAYETGWDAACARMRALMEAV